MCMSFGACSTTASRDSPDPARTRQADAFIYAERDDPTALQFKSPISIIASDSGPQQGSCFWEDLSRKAVTVRRRCYRTAFLSLGLSPSICLFDSSNLEPHASYGSSECERRHPNHVDSCPHICNCRLADGGHALTEARQQHAGSAAAQR